MQSHFRFRADRIQVDFVPLDMPANEVLCLAAWLSADEQRRAERLRIPEDRSRWIVARARLRERLAARLGILPREVVFAYGAYGKPRLSGAPAESGWRFSASRSKDGAVIAFSRQSEVGVDLERVQAVPEAERILALCFSERERARYAALPPELRPLEFARAWTRKEAMAKALGEGLNARMGELDGGLPTSSFSPRDGFVAAVAYTP